MTQTTRQRAHGRALSVVVVVAALAVTLTGCLPAPPAPTPAPSGLATPRSTAPLAPLVVPRVLVYCPLVDAVHDASYSLTVDRVYICRGDGSRATDGVSTYGPWESAYRIDHPDALLRAYRAPDARSDGRSCPDTRQDPLIVWVHHDGVTTAYYAPVDACGFPSEAATTAYQKAKRTLLLEVDRGAPLSQKDDKG